MSGEQAVGVERRALLASIAVTAVLGLIGIVWGIASGSQMILLDGVYAIVGILVSLVLLAGSAMARSEPSERYPFGRESVAPLVIGLQGFVLFTTLFYAAVEALFAFARGGSAVTAGSGFLYGVIAAVGSFAFWMWIHRLVGHSDVLRSEAIAWKVAAFRGVGMMAGFALMWLLTGTPLDWAVPYLDPAMVVVTCVVFLPASIRLMRTTMLELLEGAPPPEIRTEAETRVETVRRRFGLDEAVVRMTKVGPKLYVEVEGVADPEVTVAEEHELRTALEAELENLPLAIWLNLELLPRSSVVEVDPPAPASTDSF